MIYVLSGGQTGATLTVNSSDAGTITVSNTTLGKSYSKSVTSGGSAVFEGLKTGTWTVKLTDGSKTSTKTIKITSDYSTSIAYFAATISITYPAKSTCVVKNSSGTTVASNSNTGSSTKTWTATVGATGTYTITATSTSDSSKTKSTTVSITADGQSKSVTLSYELVLFDNGTDNTAVTGGWSKSGNTLSISATTDSMDGAKNTVYTENKISVSGYSTLHFQITSTSQTEKGYRRVGLSSETSGPNFSYYKDVTGKGEVTIPISSATSSLYVRMALEAAPEQNGQSATTSIVASKVWLT